MDIIAKEKQWSKRVEKSRNLPALKSSTVSAPRRPVKSISPLKLVGLGRGERQERAEGNEMIVSPREKLLQKKLLDLQQENAELTRLLQQNRERAKEAAVSTRAESNAMRSLLETLLPQLDERFDENLRKQIRSIVEGKDSFKMNSITTNNTDSVSVGMQTERHFLSPLEPDVSSQQTREQQEADALRQKLAIKNSQNLLLTRALTMTNIENECIKRYIAFIASKSKSQEESSHPAEHKPSSSLHIDSENVSSGEDAETPLVVGWKQDLLQKTHDTTALVPCHLLPLRAFAQCVLHLLSFGYWSVKRKQGEINTGPGFIRTLILEH